LARVHENEKDGKIDLDHQENQGDGCPLPNLALFDIKEFRYTGDLCFEYESSILTDRSIFSR